MLNRHTQLNGTVIGTDVLVILVIQKQVSGWKVKLGKGFSFPLSEFIVFKKNQKNKKTQKTSLRMCQVTMDTCLVTSLFVRKDELDLKAYIWNLKYQALRMQGLK